MYLITAWYVPGHARDRELEAEISTAAGLSHIPQWRLMECGTCEMTVSFSCRTDAEMAAKNISTALRGGAFVNVYQEASNERKTGR